MSNQKQIALAMLMYANDADQMLPPARTWSDDLLPYAEVPGIFRCPSLEPTKNTFGIAYNSWLTGLQIDKIEAPEGVPLNFDSDKLAKNAADRFTSFPAGLTAAERNRRVVAFTDGHAASLIPEIPRWRAP